MRRGKLPGFGREEEWLEDWTGASETKRKVADARGIALVHPNAHESPPRGLVSKEEGERMDQVSMVAQKKRGEVDCGWRKFLRKRDEEPRTSSALGRDWPRQSEVHPLAVENT